MRRENDFENWESKKKGMVKLLRVNYKHIRFGGAGVKARVGVLGRGVDRDSFRVESKQQSFQKRHCSETCKKKT